MKVLLKGNEAIGEGAVQAGCDAYFGYPITPQNELTAHMATRMREEGRVFLQSESELAAINMVFGAAATGKRAMTSSSSPGISLKQEGISYMAGANVPCVVVNVMRGGPGLAGIRAAQSDYFQATRGGGHGDYQVIVLAPSTVQECYDYTALAFDLADKYRNPAMILADGILGQMMEPLEIKKIEPNIPDKPWAMKGGTGNIVKSLFLHPPEALIEHNLKLQEKYKKIQENETMHETIDCDDAELIVVAFGTTARIAKGAVKKAREEGLKVGLFRPITLWPFPKLPKCKKYLVVEMNFGQMLQDVKLGTDAQVEFFGQGGGWYPSEEGIFEQIKRVK